MPSKGKSRAVAFIARLKYKMVLSICNDKPIFFLQIKTYYYAIVYAGYVFKW